MKINHIMEQNASSWTETIDGKQYGTIIRWTEFNEAEIERRCQEVLDYTYAFLKAKKEFEEKWDTKIKIDHTPDYDLKKEDTEILFHVPAIRNNRVAIAVNGKYEYRFSPEEIEEIVRDHAFSLIAEENRVEKIMERLVRK